MSSAVHYHPHYTVADYEQWEGDWELWQGTPVAMSPSPTPQHQLIAATLTVALVEAFRAAGCQDCCVLPGTDWQIADDTVVRPDLLIHCGTLPANRITTPPRLVIEVLSPSTAAKDRTFKRALYATQGVPYYVLADPATGEIEPLQLRAGGYESGPSPGQCTFQLTADCRIEVALAIPG